MHQDHPENHQPVERPIEHPPGRSPGHPVELPLERPPGRQLAGTDPCACDSVDELRRIIAHLEERLAAAERLEADHQRTERAHRENEQRIRHIIEILPVGVWVTDEQGEIVHRNTESKRIWCGAPRTDLEVEGEYLGWFAETGRRIEVADWASSRALADGTVTVNEEVDIRCFDGTRKTILNSAAPIRDRDGVTTGAVVVGLDITHLKRIESALQSALERATESDRLKTLFLATMSHEMRTPLNGILGFATLLEACAGPHLSPEEMAYFEDIRASGERLTRTIQDVLDISQFESGSFDAVLEPVDLTMAVGEVAEALRGVASQKGLEIELCLEDGTGPAPGAGHGHGEIRDPGSSSTGRPGTHVHADAYALQRALEHLVDNAVRYTETGRITIAIARSENAIELTITDTGIGIAESYRSNLFEPFTQESTGRTRAFEGLGLGLALARRYIEACGARPEIRSRKGRGTTATLRFLDPVEPVGSTLTDHPRDTGS